MSCAPLPDHGFRKDDSLLHQGLDYYSTWWLETLLPPHYAWAKGWA